MNKRIWLKLVVIAVILLTAKNTYHPCYANSFKIELPFSYEVVVPFGPIKDGIQKWHYGVDLKASLNSPFLSPIDGWVHFKGFTPVCTETLTIETDEGYLITFLNLYGVNLKKGVRVKKGEVLGFVSENINGSTETPHIHLSIRNKKGDYLNPLEFIVFVNDFSETEETEKCENQIQGDLDSKSEMQIEKENGAPKFEPIKDPQSQALTLNEKVLPSIKSQSTKNVKTLSVKPSIHTVQKNMTVLNLSRYSSGKEINMKNKRSYLRLKLNYLDKRQIIPSSMIGYYSSASIKNSNTTSTYDNAFLLLFSAIVVIICRQSLLPAMTGGRISPKGGELVARIRDNVYRPAPVNT